MATCLRVLVTGSRDWTDERAISDALRAIGSGIASQDVTVVHGHCPTGADAIADKAARIFGMNVERHPADWSLGKKAGPLRNQKMVDLGADVCLAFPLPGSRGTKHCMGAATKAGIPVLDKGAS